MVPIQESHCTASTPNAQSGAAVTAQTASKAYADQGAVLGFPTGEPDV
jgi:hypothetical protein